MAIVVLCGSTRFKKLFEETVLRLSLLGDIVISLPYFDKSEEKKLTQDQIATLTKVHYEKIAMCDDLFVIDGWVDGYGSYVGVQTQKEIDYARAKGKRIRYYSIDELG